MKSRIITISVILAILLFGGLVGWRLLSLALRSDSMDDQVGIWPTATPFTQTEIDPEDVTAVAVRLRAAGLTDDPYRDATGIETHLNRLQAGQVSPEALLQYVADLEQLNRVSTDLGARIPPTLWDVGTERMAEANVTEYVLTNELAQPALESYVGLLARSYGRFKAFKAAETENGGDTALDAALDMMIFTLDYLDGELGPPPADASQENQQERASQAVRTWQSIVVGTTRHNPLTGENMVAQTLSSRLNVVEMWRHETDLNITHPEAWGVSGFDHAFVGTPINNNQIEHMSISTFLQQDLDEPVLVLDLEEDKELLTGHSSEKAMANADIALNKAIAAEFIPYFGADPRGTVEHLRCYLKAECPSRQ